MLTSSSLKVQNDLFGKSNFHFVISNVLPNNLLNLPLTVIKQFNQTPRLFEEEEDQTKFSKECSSLFPERSARHKVSTKSRKGPLFAKSAKVFFATNLIFGSLLPCK